jgi:hypothetical protein
MGGIVDTFVSTKPDGGDAAIAARSRAQDAHSLSMRNANIAIHAKGRVKVTNLNDDGRWLATCNTIG